MLQEERIGTLVHSLELPEEEQKQLVRLMVLFAERPAPPDPGGHFPKYREYKEKFIESIDGHDPEAFEEAFLTLYAHLHMHEARYTPEERGRMDQAGGYWAHAGGLSPILKAKPWISPATVSADLGAGNGLQGLLFQYLYPHRLTIQYEISSDMVQTGRRLLSWLGIPPERVRWVAGDVCDQTFEGIDFFYLYRPVRPSTDRGRAFYERFARMLDREDRPVAIFSIADCLRSFLSSRFEVFYSDGHLTCFRSG